MCSSSSPCIGTRLHFLSPMTIKTKVSDKELVNWSPKTKSSPPLPLVNKVLLEQNHAHLNGLFTVAELSQCHRDRLAHKSENIQYLAVYRKCLPTSALD